eukprot:GHVT01001800.1.p1 GENE.GHVT01001800.1~~GHVT01001800.1.p1  ORF type:complete len:179 (-),score=61.17 GHVT01001800.1:941-1477(-)
MVPMFDEGDEEVNDDAKEEEADEEEEGDDDDEGDDDGEEERDDDDKEAKLLAPPVHTCVFFLLLAGVVASSLSGSLAGVLAQTAVFPGDTVRKRMMANGVDGRRRLYSSSFDCVAKMWKREGALSFYSGLRPCVLKAVPSGALQFGIYELCKGLFRRLHSDLPPVAYAPPPPRALPPR